jgi:uracil-DNA glycosylase
METFQELNKGIRECALCPRLNGYTAEVARTKKREFRHETYWGRPVPGFGDPRATLWIIGLAPAAHGANRTGRMFTGDSSGLWLYRALFEVGLSNQAESRPGDGLLLNKVFISSAARCAPPDNKPSPAELRNCAPYLRREFLLLQDRQRILALGKIAFDACLKLLGPELPRPRPRFRHGAEFQIGGTTVSCSYHPSRQNTNTGKLTWKMWKAVFEKETQKIMPLVKAI